MEDLEVLVNQCEIDLANVSSLHELDLVKSKYLGGKSKVKESFSQLSKLPGDKKASFAKRINEVKSQLTSIFVAKKSVLEQLELKESLLKERVDTSLPGHFADKGSLHPLSLSFKKIGSILKKLGFSAVLGPEIETEYYNFTALNTPENHPAATLQDTLYISGQWLLRSHTSSVQIRTMEKNKPPLRIFSPGRVFRADTLDATHSPCFMQCEGLVVDNSSNLSDLVATLKLVLEEFFQENLKIRLRPSYFPFTEPSLECDILFKGQWLEVLGCGMVHPNVLKNVGIDPSVYQGFAFGLGIDRLTMLKYQIDDIRHLYDGDQGFLRQFQEI